MGVRGRLLASLAAVSMAVAGAAAPARAAVPASDGYALGVERKVVPCASGPEPVWSTDGAGPGFVSTAVTSVDRSRQLVFAATAYDIGREVRGKDPAPRSMSLLTALTAAMCRP